MDEISTYILRVANHLKLAKCKRKLLYEDNLEKWNILMNVPKKFRNCNGVNNNIHCIEFQEIILMKRVTC